MKSITNSMLLAVLFAVAAHAQDENRPAPSPDWRLELTTDKPSFAVGEPIVVTLHFRTSASPFSVVWFSPDWMDQCWPPNFCAMDEQGWRVPLHAGPWLCVGHDLPPVSQVTSERPYERQAFLNEWLALDTPGKYTVLAYRAVSDKSGKPGSFPLLRGISVLMSAPLTLEITAPDETARQSLFERAARMPRGDDWASCDARAGVMRELRLIGDERALPFLVRGLFSDYFMAQHAELGLNNFPDAAKVKAALLHLLAAPGEGLRPAHFTRLASALAEADMRLQNPQHKYVVPFGRDFDRLRQQWQAALRPHFKAEIARLSPAAAAESIVEALVNDSFIAHDVALWRRVLRDAALMNPEKQRWLGGQFWKMPRDATLQLFLAQVAGNEKLDVFLRLKAVDALLQTNVTAAREIIFRDLASPSPQFGKETHARLGNYKVRERAVLLLARLRAAKEEKQRAAAEYLRDCGQGATLDELRDVYALLAKTPNSYHRENVQLAIIEAVALRSPRDGFALLKPLLDDQSLSHYDAYERLLKRLDLPEARALIVRILRSGPPGERDELILALGLTVPPQRPARQLPLLPFGRERYIGEVIEVAQRRPSPAVLRFLQRTTHIPANYVERWFQEDPKALVSAWRQWWKENRARFEK